MRYCLYPGCPVMVPRPLPATPAGTVTPQRRMVRWDMRVFIPPAAKIGSAMVKRLQQQAQRMVFDTTDHGACDRGYCRWGGGLGGINVERQLAKFDEERRRYSWRY